MIVAVLDSRAALLALRRTSAPLGMPVAACRSASGLDRFIRRRLVQAVVLGFRALDLVDLAAVRARYPGIPVVVYGRFRPDHAGRLASLIEQGSVAALLVEGVDDPVAGDLVRRSAGQQSLETTLADAPRRLRLTEPIQRRAWSRLLASADRPVRVIDLARELGVSREYLSRQFAAGGAPTLKRTIDLFRLAGVAHLLGNPGYDAATATQIFAFASPSHLNGVARRITGRPASALGALGPRGVLERFLAGQWGSGTVGR